MAIATALGLAGCGGGAANVGAPGGSATTTRVPSGGATSVRVPVSGPDAAGGVLPASQGHPQVVEPAAGVQAAAQRGVIPVGDVRAHAPSLAEVKSELRLALVAASVTNATYVNPLRYVTHWGRTDQGVDAVMPVGAPILAPGPVKVLAVIPDWYAGQPLVYFELLGGPDAGRVQFVAEQITAIAPPGSIVQRGQPLARFAASGTAIEYGWSTVSGVTLARATTGYEEGQVTPAGQSIRLWLNSLGAGAGNA